MEQVRCRHRYDVRLSAGNSAYITVIFCAGINTVSRYIYQTAAIWYKWRSNALDSLMKRLEQRWFIYLPYYSINSQAQVLTSKSMFICVFTAGV